MDNLSHENLRRILLYVMDIVLQIRILKILGLAVPIFNVRRKQPI